MPPFRPIGGTAVVIACVGAGSLTISSDVEHRVIETFKGCSGHPVFTLRIRHLPEVSTIWTVRERGSWEIALVSSKDVAQLPG